MSDGLEREPLFSMEAEQSVLGGLLLDNDSWDKIADMVSDHDFFVREHRQIFRAVASLLSAGKPVDAITVGETLDQHGHLEEIGGYAAITKFIVNTPSAANIRRYAEIVREHSMVRQVVIAAREVSEKAFSRAGMSGPELVDFAQAKMQTVSELARQGNTAGPQMLSVIMGRVVEKIDDLHAKGEQNEVTGLATGFEQLDKITTGFQPGDLVLLAARPAMGKTSFALNIAENVGIVQRKPVLIFSMEMINEQLGLRLMSSLSQIHAQRVRTGRIYDYEWPRVTEAMGKAADAPIYLDEDASISQTELRARARRIQRECGKLSLIIIDYIQLMNIDASGDNRAIELGKVSRGLKHLAKELQCPVLALSQLNRGLETRPNKRPIMSDLRDSGALEQDADTVIFIYRDEVYNENSPDKGLAEIIIGKQRNGPTGRVIVNFESNLTRFSNRDAHERLPSTIEREQKRARRAGTIPQEKSEHGADHVNM